VGSDFRPPPFNHVIPSLPRAEYVEYATPVRCITDACRGMPIACLVSSPCPNLPIGRNGRPMVLWIPEIDDVLTALISLACRGGERLRMPRVYSALSELKAREVLLSGLYFSITGAVCYSRQVEETMRSLMGKGMLVTKERDTLVVRDQAAEEVRAGLRRKLPPSAYRSLQAASKKFYRAMFKKRAVPGALPNG